MEPEPEPDVVIEPDSVDAPLGCPQCGERRMDYLVWQSDYETIKCESCGQLYCI